MKLDTVDAVFNLATNQHDVQQVQQDSFDACTLTNPIGNSITNSPANITLNFVGDYYYTCTLGRHCQAGQKLAINVSSTPATSPPPSTTTTAPPSAPSPTSNTSPDSACPLPNFLDAPADGPSVLTIFNRAGNSPPNSSSPALTEIKKHKEKALILLLHVRKTGALVMENFSGIEKEDDRMEFSPGFRFHPSDEELIARYLSKKYLDNNFSARAIGEENLVTTKKLNGGWERNSSTELSKMEKAKAQRPNTNEHIGKTLKQVPSIRGRKSKSAAGGPTASNRPEAGDFHLDASSPALFASFFVTFLSISTFFLP
ncbi:hypothetical protein LguiB_008219 [Lonicera macranthoides]